METKKITDTFSAKEYLLARKYHVKTMGECYIVHEPSNLSEDELIKINSWKVLNAIELISYAKQDMAIVKDNLNLDALDEMAKENKGIEGLLK